MGFKVRPQRGIRCLAALALALGLGAPGALASSHMDAPLITLDDPANTTDVYAFVSERNGEEYLTTALAVYPFEEPGIGPNAYRFDDNVLYEIHVATGEGVRTGEARFSYQFEFETQFRARDTILQSYDVRQQPFVANVGDAAQNLTQTYTVTAIDRRARGRERGGLVLGKGIVPPNNQGNVTPFYNQADDGENPAKGGVDRGGELDRYTHQAIARLEGGYVAFAGQRDDGFYADIQAIFEGLRFRSGADRFDSQAGFNLHTIVLDIPIRALGGDRQVVGVYATTSRARTTVLRSNNGRSRKGRSGKRDTVSRTWVQVGRQGNPLFAEGFVAIEDKDLYNRTSPTRDAELFQEYAQEPELAKLVNLVLSVDPPVVEQDRSDLVGIFVPDLIRVDLSTGPARLGGGTGDDALFSRLSIFGGDTLSSQVQAGLFGDGTVPGGFPNGRRFGDDVVDIAIAALVSDLRDPRSLFIRVFDGIDNVSENDISFNKEFPYAATPLNGRNHAHH
ncbi:MAG: DUF4331 domain-containing protein [Myxococcota bacterium]